MKQKIRLHVCHPLIQSPLFPVGEKKNGQRWQTHGKLRTTNNGMKSETVMLETEAHADQPVAHHRVFRVKNTCHNAEKPRLKLNTWEIWSSKDLPSATHSGQCPSRYQKFHGWSDSTKDSAGTYAIKERSTGSSRKFDIKKVQSIVCGKDCFGWMDCIVRKKNTHRRVLMPAPSHPSDPVYLRGVL